MSLDVYLTLDTPQPRTGSGIFVRENGATVEITREEWNRRWPDHEPVVFNNDDEETHEVYSRNITHNLNAMANAAGIYDALWRPDEIGITRARELIEPLAAGLSRLIRDPDEFKKHNPPNGWGTYEGLVDFVSDYLKACITHPGAKVNVSR